MKPSRDQTISRLTDLIFPDNMQKGEVNEQAHDIITTILAYLDDHEITHLYYEGVSTRLKAQKALKEGSLA